MSRTRLLIMAMGFIAVLLALALIAYSLGGLGMRESDPSGYGLDPTETLPQPTEP